MTMNPIIVVPGKFETLDLPIPEGGKRTNLFNLLEDLSIPLEQARKISLKIVFKKGLVKVLFKSFLKLRHSRSSDP